MWNVEKNEDQSRGGFQNRDVGRSNIRGNFGPEYGPDYARYADPSDDGADSALAETIRLEVQRILPQASEQIEILVHNGFVMLKGPELPEEERKILVSAITPLLGVKDLFNQIPLKKS